MPDLLLEIGLEEVPARMLAAAEAELLRRTVTLLEREQLLSGGAALADGSAVSFSTPRRLAVLVGGVRERQADVTEAMTGPAVKIAFKDGQPTAAAEAFARKAGVPVASLSRVETPKGEYLAASVVKAGRTAATVLAAELPREIAALYWPKNMTWRPKVADAEKQNGRQNSFGAPERFVRPVEWMVCLLGDQVVPLLFTGKRAGRTTRGHRLLARAESIEIVVPESYGLQLRGAYVLADVPARRHRIRKELDRVTRTVDGAHWREDVALVETVTHLTEWPSVVLGGFGAEFLALPDEVLVTVMRDHQKYFAVEGEDGRLLPYFLAVVNTELGEANAALIRQGNERVLRARFNDARFFWEFDRRTSLKDRASLLEAVTFHKDLGSYAAKTERVLGLARRLAAAVEAGGVRVDVPALEQAVRLAKTDLTTELVKEFTELQGIVGGLYARAEGAPAVVSEAIYDQYLPAGSEGRVPRSVEGALLGIADRLDTLGSLFRLGLEPTGSKDPFALRRAANAVVKILAETDVPLVFETMLQHMEDDEVTRGRLRAFFTERIAFYLREVRGFAYDVVTAVLVAGSGHLPDVVARAEAVSSMRGSADFLAVSAAFKRMRNILEQAEAKGEPLVGGTQVSSVPEQGVLASQAQAVRVRVGSLVAERNYRAALEAMATMRPAIDAFFDKVMVMDPDPTVRASRLHLLAEIVRGFAGIADFSEIVTAG